MLHWDVGSCARRRALRALALVWALRRLLESGLAVILVGFLFALLAALLVALPAGLLFEVVAVRGLTRLV